MATPQRRKSPWLKTYFAVQTRRQEVADEENPEDARLAWRERLSDATKGLNSAAKVSGVQKYGLFHDAGYRGLYGMGLSAIKSKKGLSPKDDLFDRAGTSDLAANFFKAEQTKERLARLGKKGEEAAKDVHKKVGEEVRATIRKLGNTMPENLPAERPIRALKKELKRLPKKSDSAAEDAV